MRVTRLRFALLALVVFPAAPSYGLVPAQAVGTVNFATSCTLAAQPMFNRSVALLHSFAFSQATDAFNGVLRTDPGCAMAWWGIALSAWGNPFGVATKPAGQIARGLGAITQAKVTGTPTWREMRYIDAAARLYERADLTSQADRVAAYRDAMAGLVVSVPTDTEAVIFHALAVVFAADPRDKTYASQLAAGATLERLFATLPNHPGLAHYIIHSYDAPPLAARALAAATRYSQIAPEISHALHMPSHTFTREGLWERSIAANVAAASAARREGSTAEELHSGDYRTYAYLQMGRDAAARQIVDSLPALSRRLDPTAVGTGASPASGFYALAATPARYALERGVWAEAAALLVQPNPIAYASAVTWFARGIGAARSGAAPLADTAAGELARIRDALALAHETYWTEQVDIQRAAVTAWRDFAAGRRTEALAAMRDAADREDATEKSAVTPGPIVPARELLGEMLLADSQPTLALGAFVLTLRHEPNRFRAVAGAAVAANTVGNRVTARKYYAELLKLGARADRPGRPALAEAARVVGKQD